MLPETSEERDIRFTDVHTAIRGALEKEDAETYVTQMSALASLMFDELHSVHGGQFGDYPHTMQSLGLSLRIPPHLQDQLKKGVNVEIRTDTATNQRGPHPSNSREVSRICAEPAARYVNRRGEGFITAQVVTGVDFARTLIYSPYQILTTAHGFRPGLRVG